MSEEIRDAADFRHFTFVGDERTLELYCKLCSKEVHTSEWWGNGNWDFKTKPEDTANLLTFLLAAGSHECPKVVSLVEDSFMTSAEMQQIKDAAVATGRYREIQPSRSKENPYANLEPTEFVERVETVKPNPNVL